MRIRSAESSREFKFLFSCVRGERNAGCASRDFTPKVKSERALQARQSPPRTCYNTLYDIKRKGPSINVGYANSVITPAGVACSPPRIITKPARSPRPIHTCWSFYTRERVCIASDSKQKPLRSRIYNAQANSGTASCLKQCPRKAFFAEIKSKNYYTQF